ncbi:unnamed protein product, partial [Vitrella brassicaformis CCMP3155]
THLYERAQSNHSAKVLRILEKWGLTEESEDRIACVAGLDGRSPMPDGEDYPLLRPVVELEGGRHYPPCIKGDEMMSQFIPDMAFLLCCSVNVQIVDYQWVKAYLEKYVAGVEEKAMASLSVARESDRNALTDVRVNSYGIQNTKIGGVQVRARQAQDQGGPAAAADGDRQPPHGPQDGTSASPDSDSKKKRRRRDTRHRQALRISYTEMLWQLHDFPHVTSSVDCIHITSLPPELRCGWKALNLGLSVDSVQNAPPQPHPDNPQGFRSGTQAVPVEARRRPLNKVSVFGIRPPELHWIDFIEEYFKWMVLSQRPPAARRNRYDVSEDLTVTPLTDGGLQTVKFRQRYLTEAVEACRQRCGSSGAYASHAAMVGFLERLQQAVVNRHDEALVQRFVESRPKHNTKEVVIVFSAVKPDNPYKFFIHLLYRFGRFICDMDPPRCRRYVRAFRVRGC